jgi:hypothetical protein
MKRVKRGIRGWHSSAASLGVALLACCWLGVAAAPARSEGSRVGESDAPKPPRGFIVPSLAPMAAAAADLESLRVSSVNRENRERIAKWYDDAHYLGAGRFFTNTIRAADGRALLVSTIENEYGWGLTGRDLDPDRYRLGEEAAHLFFAARSADAAVLARREFQTRGPSFYAAVVWSRAVLDSVLQDRRAIPSTLDVEVAVRMYLTSLEEKIPTTDDQTGGFDVLAKLFAARGDVLSFETASALAAYHAHLGGIDSDDLAKYDARRAKLLKLICAQQCRDIRVGPE